MSDLSAWLASHGLSAVESVLLDNDIDLDLLAELTEGELTELGFSLGQRKRFLRAVAQDSASTSASYPPSSAPSSTDRRPTEAPAERAERVEQPISGSVNTQVQSPGHAGFNQQAERRQLTVMFCDLIGSTQISEQLELEDLRRMIGKYQATISQAVESNGGYIARFLGDGMLSYFGYPAAMEDDAIRATNTGLDIVDAVARLSEEIDFPLNVRVGIATGLVVAGDIIGQGGAEEHQVLGETPNLAARLESAAHPNTVFVSTDTWQLVSRQFSGEVVEGLTLKGISKTNSAYQITGRSSTDPQLATDDVPLVGRERELGRVISQWEDAVNGHPQFVLISGEAGIGKSRLLREFFASISNYSPTTIYLGCAQARAHSAFFPVLNWLRNYFADAESVEQKLSQCQQVGLTDDEGALLLDLLGIELPPDLQERLPLNAVARRGGAIQGFVKLVSRCARSDNVVLVVEDIHWMDPSSLETMVAVLSGLTDERVLIVASSRPEFDPKPFQTFTHTSISLSTLSREETQTLVRQVSNLDEKEMEEVLSKTDGVPLFVEELAKSVAEAAESQHDEVVPKSLRGSLMARLDRLSEAKEIAQIASVAGREFSAELIENVAALPGQQFRTYLDKLLAAGLVQVSDAIREIYIFKHALVQDTAYDSLLKEDRRNLHGRVADKIVQLHPETSESEPEVLAHHYTESNRQLEAADHWYRAGRLAASKSANAECIVHLQRGLDILSEVEQSPPRDRIELDHQVLLSGVYKGAKGLAAPEVAEVCTRALELSERLNEPESQIITLSSLYSFNLLRSNNEQALHFAQRLLSASEEDGGQTHRMIGNRALGAVSFHRGQLRSAKSHIETSLSLYDEDLHGRSAFIFGSDHRELATGFYGITLWLLGEQQRGLAVQREVVRYCEALGHDHSYAQSAVFLSVLCALAQAPDAYQIADELVGYTSARHFPMMQGAAQFFRGAAEYRLGHNESGLRDMLDGGDMWWSTGASNYRPYGELLISLGLLGVGDTEDGLNYLAKAEERMHRSQEYWCHPELLRVQAQFAEVEGDHETAERKYQEGLVLAAKNDSISWHARLNRSYAAMLLSLDRKEQARRLFAEEFDHSDFSAWEVEAERELLGTLGLQTSVV